MSELSQRLIVSAIFIPLLLIAIYLEGVWLFGLFLLLSVLGSIEYRQIMCHAGHDIPGWTPFLMPFFYCAWVFFPHLEAALLWIGIFCFALHAVFHWHEKNSLPAFALTVFGLIYTALFPALIVKIGWYHPVPNILLALILMVWIVDTMAYFIGMRFGKKRGVVPVSPRKSREGFIAGGVAPWLVLGVLYLSGFSRIPWAQMFLVAIAAGVFGQFGDLLESMLKRYSGVKDSSRLIPGHGGVLDRMDSVLFAGSFLYVAIAIFG